jgi:hypothetical protein
MTNDQKSKLVEYFKKNLKKGYTVDALKWALMTQGYSRSSIELAIMRVNEELAKKAPILEDKPKIDYQLIDENNNPIKIEKPWWRKLFG